MGGVGVDTGLVSLACRWAKVEGVQICTSPLFTVQKRSRCFFCVGFAHGIFAIFCLRRRIKAKKCEKNENENDFENDNTETKTKTKRKYLQKRRKNGNENTIPLTKRKRKRKYNQKRN